MQRLGMVYFAIVGGAAALETTQIEEKEEVAWEELMPECLWKFRVKDSARSPWGSTRAETRSTTTCRLAAGEKLKELFAALISCRGWRDEPCDQQGARPARHGRTSSRRRARFIDIVKLGGSRPTSPRTCTKLEVLTAASKHGT